MPNINEIRKCRDVGINRGGNAFWRVCVDCGEGHWLASRYKNYLRCHKCTFEINRVHKPLKERFYKLANKVGDNECWEWIGTKDRHGYGYITDNHERKFAHRVSYELHSGPIIEGAFIIHSCDNPSCVNPNHLRQGTAQDNVDDMISRGRANHYNPRGEEHGRAKLTWEQVREIRGKYIPFKYSTTRLGKEFGISQGHIARIISGLAWIE